MDGQTQTEDLQELLFTSFAEFGADPECITLDARLEELGIDSLDLVELGQIVQDRYDVKLLPDELKDIVTVQDALSVIERRLR